MYLPGLRVNKTASAFSRAGFYPGAEDTEASSSSTKSSQMGNGKLTAIGSFLLGPSQIAASRWQCTSHQAM